MCAPVRAYCKSVKEEETAYHRQPSLLAKEGFENRALAIPPRLARDLPQGRTGDRDRFGGGQKQQVLLDRRSEVQQRQELADASR